MKCASRYVAVGAVFVLLHAIGACSDEPGVRIDIALESPSSPPRNASGFEVTTPQGYRVAVTRGALSIGSIALGRCPTAFQSVSWVRSAHAHGTSTPTKLAIPVVESLIAPVGTRTPVGLLEPPAGAYCRVTVEAKSADADAVGLAGEPSMAGKTLLIAGTWSRGAKERQPFQLTTTASFEANVDIERLALDGDRVSSLIITKDATHWFDDVEFEALDELEAARRVLDQVRVSLSADVLSRGP